MICILSTDTPHHRYFINRIIDSGIDVGKIYFETTSVKPKFIVSPFFENETEEYESSRFFQDVSQELPEVDIMISKTINDEQVQNDLQKLNPSLGIVFGTRLVKPHIIDKFKTGLINVHRGIAQEYRGLDSDLWAIYHKDFKDIGVTIHFIDNSLDTGDIVSQDRLDSRKDMEIFHLRYYTTVMATDLVITAAEEYLAGRIQRTPQTKFGRYYSFMPLDLKHDVARKFKKHVSKLQC